MPSWKIRRENSNLVTREQNEKVMKLEWERGKKSIIYLGALEGEMGTFSVSKIKGFD